MSVNNLGNKVIPFENTSTLDFLTLRLNVTNVMACEFWENNPFNEQS